MKGAAEIIERLHLTGFQAYVVGGSVRDRELGLPAKDIDIATDATPEQVMAVFRATPAKVIPTGVKHGTVTVLLGGSAYEVTTFRRDVECDGRHAVVEATSSLEEDLARRDFTVNAMAFDPVTGDLLDPFGGREDLKSRRIRAVGEPDARFEEDHLRVMRAIRFASQLDFEVESGTWQALLRKAPLLERISRERVADELWGILAGRAAARGLALLDESGILDRILPELAACKGVAQPDRWHMLDVFEHTMLAFRHSEEQSSDPVTRMAVLLHDVGKPATASEDATGIHFHGHEQVGASLIPDLIARMKLASSKRVALDGKQLCDRLQLLVRMHPRPVQLDGAKPPALRRFVREAGSLLDELLLVARCDRLAHRNPDVAPLEELARRIAVLAPPHEIAGLQSPLSGQEIMDLLGLRPGPAVGRAKDALVDALVAGDLPCEAEAARAWLLEKYGG